MKVQPPPDLSRPSLLTDVRYLLATLPTADRRKLGLNACAQFILAAMDLLGVAAILPLMQVLMNAPLNDGGLGVLYRVVGEPSRRTFVLELGATMIGAFAIKTALALWLTWWSGNHITRMLTATARRLLGTYMSEDYLQHRKRNTGELIRNVGTAVTDAHTKVLGGLMSALSSLLSIMVLAALLLVVSPVPTLLAIAYFGVTVFLVQRILGPANRRAGQEAQHTSWVSSHALVDAMNGFREAVLHNARHYFVDRYDLANRRTAHASLKANYFSTMPKYLLELVTMVGLTVFIVGAILTDSAKSAMPTLSLFVAAVIKILPTMVALTATLGFIRVGREGLRITVDALKNADIEDAERTPTSDQHATLLLDSTAHISVDDVSFRYPDGDQRVLRNISFDVPRGSSLAICGVSGSGKTTLIDIMLGLIAPTQGRVTYGGVPTTTAGDTWHEIVAYVPQDVYITDSTLAGNVAFGVPEAERDLKKVRRCLDQAALGELVSSLPDGLETLVGERGTRLSGGQRQRLGIARALYRDPEVLVLDEATSALDNETEYRITQTLERLHGQITTVIVAHRLSTVKDVDRLVFLSDGRVAASGTFTEVVHASPEFARLVALGKLDEDKGDSVG